jgi:drug/metabolite transporter (DMT)-like permease
MDMKRPASDSQGLVDAGLVLVVVMWALTFSMFKVAWREVDPVAFTAVRFGVMVLLALGVIALSRNRVPLRRADQPLVAASALSGFFAYQLLFILGLDRTTAVASAILISTHPIFSVLFGWLLGRERPSAGQVAGIAVAFGGVAVFLRAWDALGTATWGDLLSLGAAAAFGAYGVINQPLSKRYPGRELMAYSLVLGGGLVFLVGLSAAIDQDWGGLSVRTWLIMVFAVVGPVYLAYAIWNWAIHRRGIARTVPYGFAVPVVASAIAVASLGESIHPEQIAGGLLVVAGLVITRLAPQRTRARAPDERVLDEVG